MGGMSQRAGPPPVVAEVDACAGQRRRPRTARGIGGGRRGVGRRGGGARRRAALEVGAGAGQRLRSARGGGGGGRRPQLVFTTRIDRRRRRLQSSSNPAEAGSRRGSTLLSTESSADGGRSSAAEVAYGHFFQRHVAGEVGPLASLRPGQTECTGSPGEHKRGTEEEGRAQGGSVVADGVREEDTGSH